MFLELDTVAMMIGVCTKGMITVKLFNKKHIYASTKGGADKQMFSHQNKTLCNAAGLQRWAVITGEKF